MHRVNELLQDDSGLTLTLIGVIIGAILGFVGTGIIELLKRHWANDDQKVYSKKLLQAISKEIEEGITRCEWLIEASKDGKGSYSRIYIALWDSSRIRIAEVIEDTEILHLLHKIYYRFDLINFNMENGRFGPGAAFAREYISDIKSSYELLKRKIDP